MPFDPNAVGKEALRSFVISNRQRLQQARAALDLPHVVPVDYQSSDVNIEWIRDMRSLSRAFTGEGDLAVMENRFDDAAMHYLDVIRLGCVTAGGGLAVDWLVGIAIEGVDRSRLCSLLESIPPQTLPRLIAELQQLDASQEPADDALRRERVWQQHAYGWPMRIWFVPAVEQTKAVKQATRENIAKTRLLLCDLALRLYLEKHKDIPDRLEQLVPEYLSTLPDDPFSEQPFIYRPHGKTFLLYSVGPDHKDDGGAVIPGGALVGDGDLLLTP